MIFSASVFDPDVFDAEAVPVTVQNTQGLLMKMKPVPYRGPVTGARVISPVAIRAARRKFRHDEDEWLLGVLTDAEYMEVA